MQMHIFYSDSFHHFCIKYKKKRKNEKKKRKKRKEETKKAKKINFRTVF